MPIPGDIVIIMLSGGTGLPGLRKGIHMSAVQVSTSQKAERQYLTLKGVIDDATEQDDCDSSHIKVQRVRDPEAIGPVGNGFTYQPCGGGRRIIRRQRGGSY